MAIPKYKQSVGNGKNPDYFNFSEYSLENS